MFERLKMIKGKFEKVSIKDRNLWREYTSQVAIISSIVTLISFCTPSPSDWKWRISSSILLPNDFIYIQLVLCQSNQICVLKNEWYKG